MYGHAFESEFRAGSCFSRAMPYGAGDNSDQTRCEFDVADHKEFFANIAWDIRMHNAGYWHQEHRGSVQKFCVQLVVQVPLFSPQTQSSSSVPSAALTAEGVASTSTQALQCSNEENKETSYSGATDVTRLSVKEETLVTLAEILSLTHFFLQMVFALPSLSGCSLASAYAHRTFPAADPAFEFDVLDTDVFDPVFVQTRLHQARQTQTATSFVRTTEVYQEVAQEKAYPAKWRPFTSDCTSLVLVFDLAVQSGTARAVSKRLLNWLRAIYKPRHIGIGRAPSFEPVRLLGSSDIVKCLPCLSCRFLGFVDCGNPLYALHHVDANGPIQPVCDELQGTALGLQRTWLKTDERFLNPMRLSLRRATALLMQEGRVFRVHKLAFKPIQASHLGWDERRRLAQRVCDRFGDNVVLAEAIRFDDGRILAFTSPHFNPICILHQEAWLEVVDLDIIVRCPKCKQDQN